MQLGRQLGCPRGSCQPRTIGLPSGLPRQALAPPTVACPPAQRLCVLVHAKRASKRATKQPEDDGGAAGESASGWDAALAGVPTEDEAQPDDVMVAAAAAERTAEQASDADSGASTSYSLPTTGRRSAATPAVPSPPPSTVLSLAEYQLLMEAKEQAKREEEERKRREAGTAVAVPEPAPLDISRQGFQSFAMDGGDWELLVAETADGRLALADSYVARGGGEGEGAQQSYSRPSVEEDVPAEPLLFQVIPWVERGSSDLFKRRKSSAKVKKVFFVSLLPDPEEPQGEPLFDLDNVFVFDGGSKGFSRTEVRQVHSGPLLEPVLRIRPSGLTLEESFLVPDPIEISEGAAADLADVSEEELAERLAELEKQAEMMDEMDEMPDVPSVDMM